MIKTLIIAISIYYIVALSILVYVFARSKSNKISTAEFLYSTAVVLVFPVIGIIIFLFSNMKMHSKRNINDLIPEIHFTGTRSDILYKSDPIRERNIVPIEEALIINNNQTKRALLIEALKRDFLKGLYFIQKAIRDKDTETSHYAASALMELKDKLTRNLREAMLQYNQDKKNIQYLEIYRSAIKQVIESNLNSDADQESLSRDYISVLEQLILEFPDEEGYYQDLINFLIKNNDVSNAELVCARYLICVANSEVPYLLYLKIYYLLGQQKEFREILALLQASNIKLSSHGISILRFWLQEGESND